MKALKNKVIYDYEYWNYAIVGLPNPQIIDINLQIYTELLQLSDSMKS